MAFNNSPSTVSLSWLLLIMIMAVGSVKAIVYEYPTHKTYQTYDPRALGQHYPQPQPQTQPQYGYEKYEETSYHQSEPASHSRPAYLEPPLVSSQSYTAVHTPSYSQPPVYRPPQQHRTYGDQGHAASRYGLTGSAFQQAQRQLQGASLPFGRNGEGGGQQKGFLGSYIVPSSAQGQGFGHGAAIYTPARLLSPGYRQSYHHASSSGPAAGISTRNGFGYHPSSYQQQRQPLSHQLLAMYKNRELPDGLLQGGHVTASRQLQHRQPQQHQQLHPLPPQEKEYRSNEEVFEASLVDTKSSADYDPCEGLPDGEHALGGDFQRLLPQFDPTCFFIKCSHARTYLNPCGSGTRNADDGVGFCSARDDSNICGVSRQLYTDLAQRISQKSEGGAVYEKK